MLVVDKDGHEIEKADEASLESPHAREPRHAARRLVAPVSALTPENVHVAPAIPLQQPRQIDPGALEGVRTEQAAEVGIGGVDAVVLHPRQSAQLVVRHPEFGQELNRLTNGSWRCLFFKICLF